MPGMKRKEQKRIERLKQKTRKEKKRRKAREKTSWSFVAFLVLGGLFFGGFLTMMYVRHESNIAKMKCSKVLVDIRTLSVDVTRYKTDNGFYPSTSQGLAALLQKSGSDSAPGNFPDDGTRESIPLDPWDRPYRYRYPGEHKDFDLYTLGADGKPGGDGLDMDAGNWNLEEFAKAME